MISVDRKFAAGLVAAVLLQLVILMGMQVNAALPLWTGTEVRVNTMPVDPRSLFRGNYARLGYTFSRFPADSLNEVFSAQDIRAGQRIYVSLRQDASGIHQPASVSLTKPSEGMFLRGRVAYRHRPGDDLAVRYGIEALFAPKEEALALERRLRDGAVAVLMVSDDGQARIQRVEAERE